MYDVLHFCTNILRLCNQTKVWQEKQYFIVNFFVYKADYMYPQRKHYIDFYLFFINISLLFQLSSPFLTDVQFT